MGNSHCFESDDEVEEWLRDPESVLRGPTTTTTTTSSTTSTSMTSTSISTGTTTYEHRPRRQGLGLFAYPGQSNMSGRRLPLSWLEQVRSSPALQNTYTLLDCAALAMTSPLNDIFQDPDAAPDFTCLSFYKIFGFPDLGALIVRKDSGHILTLRKYFGGGTVTMVSVIGGSWHKIKSRDTSTVGTSISLEGTHQASTTTTTTPDHQYNLHDGLEDGTLPFHNILALGMAIDVHSRLYGSMYNISRHTTTLSLRLYQRMQHLTHPNGRKLCKIYTEDDGRGFGDSRKQGATIAFNLLDAVGMYIPYSDVEKICNKKGFYVRSGGKLYLSPEPLMRRSRKPDHSKKNEQGKKNNKY